jgi:Ca-activated chloride channel family protein
MSLKVGLLSSLIALSALTPAYAADSALNHVGVALVLDVDATGSIDEHRWALQTAGIAEAIRDPEVVDAIGNNSGGVAVAVIEWVDANLKATPIDWTILSDRASIDAFATRMRGLPRLFTGSDDQYAAIEYSIAAFERAPPADRRVIDFSSDDPPYLNVVGAINDATRAGIIVNGLPVIDGDPAAGESERTISRFRKFICTQPEAFCLVAHGYVDFTRALIAKLILEIS